MLQTIRKTLTKLEVSGYVPGSIVVHSNHFEGIELALSTVNAVEHLSLPFDAAARRLWGCPLVVVSTAVTAGALPRWSQPEGRGGATGKSLRWWRTCGLRTS